MTTNRKNWKWHGFKVVTIIAVSGWFMMNATHAATYTLKVDGLACPFCSYGIEKQLRKLPGVSNITTNIKTGTVKVKTKSGKKLTEAQLRTAVKKSGFSLRGIK